VIKSAKLARLWVALKKLQPYADKYGVGNAWQEAYTYRTRDAIYKAFDAVHGHKDPTGKALANLMWNAWAVTNDVASSPNMLSFVEAVLTLSEQTFIKLEGATNEKI
tara:strand:+ start:10383 stop:10703 length:321 start_codon:yes stop_codon:yes gene_type:complete